MAYHFKYHLQRWWSDIKYYLQRWRSNFQETISRDEGLFFTVLSPKLLVRNYYILWGIISRDDGMHNQVSSPEITGIFKVSSPEMIPHNTSHFWTEVWCHFRRWYLIIYVVISDQQFQRWNCKIQAILSGDDQVWNGRSIHGLSPETISERWLLV